MELTKSVSFPSCGSTSGRKGSDSSKQIKNLAGNKSNPKGVELQIGKEAPKSAEFESSEDLYRRSMSSVAAYKVDGILNFNEAMVERGINPSSGLYRGQNQIVTKRFKNLKQKIKHVIRESRKERRRITMDAILHKIPHGHEFSKDSKKESPREGKDSPASGYESDCSVQSLTKRQMHRMRRTSSLNNSLDRYCQLYETSFNREAKQTNSERLKLKMEEVLPVRIPKSFGRILSLPDLESYFYQNEESFDTLFPKTLIRTSGNSTMSRKGCTNDKNSLDLSVDSKTQLQLDKSVDNTTEESFCNVSDKNLVTGNDEVNENVGVIKEDYGNFKDGDSAVCSQQDIGPAGKNNAIEEEGSSLSLPDYNFLKGTTRLDELSVSEDVELDPRLPDELDNLAEQHETSIDTPEVVTSREDLHEFEILSKHSNYGIPELQVDAKNKAEFTYVRDVLELSGFDGHDSLWTWHSADQPVDPSVYEEIEGCLLLDPDCSGNEECGHCNHMFLFDLINEVLVEIYGRSYSYCSMPLSSLCHIRPMPAGNHVLREVWSLVSWYLSLRSEVDQPLDYAVSRDLEKGDGWMNLQFETECVGLELENLIIDDILEEIICTSELVAGVGSLEIKHHLLPLALDINV